MTPINLNFSGPCPKMQISFRFDQANEPVTIHVPASGGFTMNVHPPAGGVGQVKDEPIKAEPETPKVANPKVYFDMAVDGKPAGRVVMELFADTTPVTAENFRALCTGEKGMGKLGKPLHYKGSKFHYVASKCLLYGGDITTGDGRGGESIYGGLYFDDENFIRQHTGPGFLCMNNTGPDTNRSQFMIGMMEKPDPYLGYECVVFGKVVQGLDVLMRIDKEVATETLLPSKLVVIADCGQIS